MKLDLADDAGIAALFARGEVSRGWCTSPRRPGCATRSQDPHAYVRSNVTGTLNVLEGCRHHGVEHLVYASTSSVYGANTNMPFSVHHSADAPAVAVRRDASAPTS